MNIDEAKEILNNNGFLVEETENPYNLNEQDIKLLEHRIHRAVDGAMNDVAKSIIEDLGIEYTTDNQIQAYNYVKHKFNELYSKNN